MDKREVVFQKLQRARDYGADPEEVYHGLVEAAFQMRDLTIRDRRAFWTSGYEPDRLYLLEAMRRASLPEGSPEYAQAHHLRWRQVLLESHWKEQTKRLHRVASSGGLSKELRKRLLAY